MANITNEFLSGIKPLEVRLKGNKRRKHPYAEINKKRRR